MYWAGCGAWIGETQDALQQSGKIHLKIWLQPCQRYKQQKKCIAYPESVKMTRCKWCIRHTTPFVKQDLRHHQWVKYHAFRESHNNTVNHTDLSMVLKLAGSNREHIPLCCCLVRRASLCFSPHPRHITILTLWILTQALPYRRKAQESFMNIDEWSLMSLWNLHIGVVP